MGYALMVDNGIERKYFNRFTFHDIQILDELIDEKEHYYERLKYDLVMSLLLLDKDKSVEEKLIDVRKAMDDHFELIEEVLAELTMLRDLQSMLEYRKVVLYDEVNGQYYVKRDKHFIAVTKDEYKEYLKEMYDYYKDF